MKYLHLPIHLVEFWYPEAIAFFTKTWKNLMLFLEEDLAVTLMWRLLLTPLFHDSSFVGRILSFVFRLSRVLMGLFAFSLASVALFLIALYWFTLPVLAFVDMPYLFSRGFFLVGLGLFLIHITTHPHKKVWQVTEDNLWSASELKKENLNFNYLLNSPEVTELLLNLELQLKSFPDFEILDLEGVAKKAYDFSKKSNSSYIGTRHFFVSALEEIPGIDNMLLKLELKLSDFEQALYYLEKRKIIWRRIFIWDDDFVIHHLKGVNRGWIGVPTPDLDLYSTDLTSQVSLDPYPKLTRESTVIPEVVNILSQSSGRNVMIVGPAGVGKTALLRHLAKLIVTGDAPSSLATKRIVLLDLTKLISGIKTQGDLAQRIKEIFEQISFAQNIILAIEEIHELGIGEAGSNFNLLNLMENYLEEDAFQFIGTTEAENYMRILEKNSTFAHNFRKIELESASSIDTLNILEYRSIESQRKTGVKVTFIALKACVELSQKFIRDRVLPDSAISVLKESLTESVNGWVNKEIIRKVISSRVKVPMMDVGNVDKSRMLNLETELHGRLIGQDSAVKAVSDALRRSATGLSDDGRPIGSFLFVGPTGVGKTELAKTLAEVYFGGEADKSRSLSEAKGSYFKTEGAFLRFDMSEYQNPESVVRFLGGSGEGGLLTEAVRNRPYALLLLDEFEKANDKILTLFLQVLDDGRLTDGAGRVIDFENTIIIATSNAASLTIAQGLQQGRSLEKIDKQVNDELLKVFKPELVNRFDEVVIFKPLSPSDLEKIVSLKIKILQDNLRNKGYLVEFTSELLAELVKRGYDPVLGARPLRRLMQDSLEAEFSRLILEGKLNKGEVFKAGVELLSSL